MRFAYVILADSVSAGTDGKLNALGLNVRVLNIRGVPALVTLALLGMVESDIREAGEYPFRLGITAPDGTRTELVNTTGRLPDEVADERLPTGFGFAVPFTGTVSHEGLYTFDLAFADQTAEYVFLVRAPEPVADEPAPAG